MSQTLSDILGELARLHEAATPAPWTNDNDMHVYADQGPKSKMWLGTCPTNMVISTGLRGVDPHNDAALIAAMRTHLPTLLRVVPTLMQVLEEARHVAHLHPALEPLEFAIDACDKAMGGVP